MIPGGSSSGSAVAVSSGQVTFALGTDTAGSGRVPLGSPTSSASNRAAVFSATQASCRLVSRWIAFSNLRADRGRRQRSRRCGQGIRRRAIRSLAPEPIEIHSRPNLAPGRFRFGIPSGDDLVFFGDTQAEQVFSNAVRSLERLGGLAVPIDFSPFRETGRLLYEGPWVAERLVAGGEILARDPGALLPVIRDILSEARGLDAVSAFRGFYKLEALRRAAAATWDLIDVLVVPTSPTIYSIEQIRGRAEAL